MNLERVAHNSNAGEANGLEVKQNFNGSALYFFRHAGIEEGAHAAHFLSRRPNKKVIQDILDVSEQISSQEKSIPGNEKKPNKIIIYSKNNIHLVDGVTIRLFIQELVDRGADFSGDIEQAIALCLQFIEGVLFVINKLSRSLSFNTKFAIVWDDSINDYFYYEYHHDAVCINLRILNMLASPTLGQTTVDNFAYVIYQQQIHEKKAMLWQMRDARQRGELPTYSLLRSYYQLVRQRSQTV